jgi:hypothetical protein
VKYRIMLGMLLTSIAFGQAPNYPRDISLCWTHPTLYEDGTDIQPGDLGNTRLTLNRHDGTQVMDVSVPMVGDPGTQQCSTQVGVIPQPGTYTALAYAITVDSISSDASNPASKKYTGKPLPPSGTAVQ